MMPAMMMEAARVRVCAHGPTYQAHWAQFAYWGPRAHWTHRTHWPIRPIGLIQTIRPYWTFGLSSPWNLFGPSGPLGKISPMFSLLQKCGPM